jgi:hypothetical protein
MFLAIRRHVNATSVVAVLALVFAMTGGAYAASKYLITSTKQISPKVLKSLQGKAGPAGAQGAAGAGGPQGAQGSVGPAGSNGTNGSNGTKGETGPAGGKGATGPAGKTGEPWPAGGTLPSKATETGGWEFGDGNAGTGETYTAISFTIPLAKALPEKNAQGNPVGFPTGAVGTAGEEHIKNCPGNVEEPKAAPGFLCVYTGASQEISTNFPLLLTLNSSPSNLHFGASTTGSVLLEFSEGPKSYAVGSWAVTGE